MKKHLSLILLSCSLLFSDAPVVQNNNTPENQEKAAQVETCRMHLATNTLRFDFVQKSGCCSWHGGVCGCSNGRASCCDGSLSPSCGCD